MNLPSIGLQIPGCDIYFKYLSTLAWVLVPTWSLVIGGQALGRLVRSSFREGGWMLDLSSVAMAKDSAFVVNAPKDGRAGAIR
jgi:hypothetical protein